MRTLTEAEKRNLDVLSVRPRWLDGPTPSSPFSSSETAVRLYRPEELKARETKRTPRTEFFKTAIQDLASSTGGRVPYVFRVSDLALRSLDAGCLGFLYNRPDPEIALELDDEGYVAAILLTDAGRRTSPAYRLDDLVARGQKPALQRLISEAKRGGSITYGDLADNLRVALRMPAASHHHMGYVTGALMGSILKYQPDAPLLNLLVVRSDSEEAGSGARSFVEDRYGKLSPRRFESQVAREIGRVWAFGHRWDEIYRSLFGASAVRPKPERNQFDRDGKGDNPGNFRGGESEAHRSLKVYVANNPKCLGLTLTKPTTSLEKSLLSGDIMDVEIADGSRRIGVEVKSWRSGPLDLRRGIFQCIKYREVMKAQYGLSGCKLECSAVLVVERKLPPELNAIAVELGVPVVTITTRWSDDWIDRGSSRRAL